MNSILSRFILLIAVLVVCSVPARAVDIREVTSPGGIKAWLVQDSTVPLVAMQFSFKGGAAHDPENREGASNFLSAMLDEGAGDLDSATFQRRRDELAFKMSFSAGTDFFEGSFQTLARNRDPSFAMLKLALTAPRFDADAVERIRQQLIVALKNDLRDPEAIASRAWLEAALPGTVYARGSDGTIETVEAMTAEDLRAVHGRLFRRAGLQIAVVGDIDAAQLARVLDDVFGSLPIGDPVAEAAPVEPQAGPMLKVIDFDIPQSIIFFGQAGILRDDPEFIPAFVMSFILGGGGFGSRLTTEIREKRGLTYGVSIGLVPLESAGLVMGTFGTRNEKAAEAIAVVRAELARMANDGPTLQELEDAKTYLTGSYALRFDTNSKIASQLLGIQQENLGIDYIDRRNSLVEAVTVEQVREQARRLLDADRLIVTVVGKPEGLPAKAKEG